MVTPVVRSRSEGQAVRPFVGLNGLQALLDQAWVYLNTGYDEAPVLTNTSVPVSHRHISKMGVRLDLKVDAHQLMQVVSETTIPLDSITVVVIAKDAGPSPLSETEVVKIATLDQLIAPLTITKTGDSSRSRIMTNKFDGYSLQIVMVLNHDLEPKPLRPRRKGTILASSSLTISTSDPRGGLKPQKLTNEIRQENLLPSSTWFFVKKLDSYLDAQSLSDAFVVYVDEKILDNSQKLSGGARRVTEHMFTVPALTEVIHGVSRELGDGDYDDDAYVDGSSAVLSLIYNRVTKVSGETLSHADFLKMLRENPGRVASLSLAAGEMKRRLNVAVDKLIGEEVSGEDEE
jgi:hypothetical protein